MKKRQNPEPGRKARALLAANVAELMARHRDWAGSQRKLGERAKVAGRSIGYMLDPEEANPSLDNVAKVAAAFGIPVWQLFHPDLPTAAEAEVFAAFIRTSRK